jgi:hypothetical protein
LILAGRLGKSFEDPRLTAASVKGVPPMLKSAAARYSALVSVCTVPSPPAATKT